MVDVITDFDRYTKRSGIAATTGIELSGECSLTMLRHRSLPSRICVTKADWNRAAIEERKRL
jgi:hypothetical protein